MTTQQKRILFRFGAAVSLVALAGVAQVLNGQPITLPEVEAGIAVPVILTAEKWLTANLQDVESAVVGPEDQAK